MSVSFRIDELPKLKNQLLHAPWRKVLTHTNRWHWKVRQALGHRVSCVKDDPVFPYDYARVTLTRHSSVEPDYDGLVMSGAVILDALVKRGILVDDDPSHLEAVYSWEKASPKKGFIEVEVEAVERPEVAA